MSLAEINKVLSLSTKKVTSNVKVVTPNDVGVDHMLRLDSNLMTRKSFVPRIAVSQADTEDRTLPRIVGSPYILGCLIAIPWINPLNSDTTNIQVGFYIHSLEFKYALQPNTNLVYDAQETNELWLVTYNKETIEYRPKKAGELLVNNYTIVPTNTNTIVRCLMELYINVTKDSGIFFNKEHRLEKGYHSVKFYLNNTKRDFCETSLTDKDEIEVKNITKEQFDKSKKTQTTLESMPVFTEVKKVSKLERW